MERDLRREELVGVKHGVSHTLKDGDGGMLVHQVGVFRVGGVGLDV